MNCNRLFSSPIELIRLTVMTAMAFLLTVSAAYAQMTAADIERLRDRGRAEGWTFTVGESWATRQDMSALCGTVLPQSGAEKAYPVKPLLEKMDLPASFDWRSLGGCTSVKSQGHCGSCWAFATTSVMESMILIKDGLDVDLSEQWLVSCNVSDWGCDGGYFAYNYFSWQVDKCSEVGGVVEADFAYTASEVPCAGPFEDRNFFIDSWAFIDSPYVIAPTEAIKQAIYQYGPVSVMIRVDSAFNAYTGGVFNVVNTTWPNHGVALVGWDDNMGTEGVWILKNSWDTDWGEDGYMYIEYGCSNVGIGASYVIYNGGRKVFFGYPGGVPGFLNPGEATTFEVSLEGALGGIPDADRSFLHYSVNGGTLVETPMTKISSNLCEAELPALACGDDILFYVSAEDDTGTRFYGDTALPFRAVAALVEKVILDDDFETDQGWTVYGDAVSGMWERGVPAPDDGTSFGFPVNDYDGSGQCYLTGNDGGISFVDSGSTHLVSPMFVGSYDKIRVRYARWVSGGSGGYPVVNDSMMVFVSNDNGGSWTLAESVGPFYQAEGGWYVSEFMVSDYVAPSNQMKIRFEIGDMNEWSPVEAAIDAVTITAYKCQLTNCGDVNCSGGDPDIADITRLIDYLYISHAPLCDPLAADVNGTGGEPDITDITRLISHLYLEHGPLDCL